MVEGSCFCGTVRYQASEPFNSMMSCHCSMCRKHHGAAFATYVSAPLERFRWMRGEDALLKYQSSPQGIRNSCSVCGSTVPMTLETHDLVVLPAGPLEGDLGIKPQAHIFVGSKATWYTITDDLVQHEEYPPQFARAGMPRPSVAARPGISQGSCLCGTVAYEATGEALVMQHCHCLRVLPTRPRGRARQQPLLQRGSIPAIWIRGAEQVRGIQTAREAEVLHHRVLQPVRRSCAARVFRARRRRDPGGNTRHRPAHTAPAPHVHELQSGLVRNQRLIAAVWRSAPGELTRITNPPFSHLSKVHGRAR